MLRADAQDSVGIVPEQDQTLTDQNRNALLRDIHFDESSVPEGSAAAVNLWVEGISNLRTIEFDAGSPSNSFLRLAAESGGISGLLSKQITRSYFAQPGTASAEGVNIDSILAFNVKRNELVVTPAILNYTPSLVASFVIHELAHSWHGNHVICEKGRKIGTVTCDPYASSDGDRPAPYRLQLDYLLALANNGRNISPEVRVNAVQVALELATDRLNGVPEDVVSSISKRSREIQEQYREATDNNIVIDGKPLSVLMDMESSSPQKPIADARVEQIAEMIWKWVGGMTPDKVLKVYEKSAALPKCEDLIANDWKMVSQEVGVANETWTDDSGTVHPANEPRGTQVSNLDGPLPHLVRLRFSGDCASDGTSGLRYQFIVRPYGNLKTSFDRNSTSKSSRQNEKDWDDFQQTPWFGSWAKIPGDELLARLVDGKNDPIAKKEFKERAESTAFDKHGKNSAWNKVFLEGNALKTVKSAYRTEQNRISEWPAFENFPFQSETPENREVAEKSVFSEMRKSAADILLSCRAIRPEGVSFQFLLCLEEYEDSVEPTYSWVLYTNGLMERVTATILPNAGR